MTAPFESPCRPWCGPEGCNPAEDIHTTGGLIAREGIADPDMPVDITVRIAVEQHSDTTATVVVRTDTWIRCGDTFMIPGQLMDLLPAVSMTATRAREVARLLLEQADVADRINDGPEVTR